jgi:phosphoribosyl-dephospho-CoA transferase
MMDARCSASPSLRSVADKTADKTAARLPPSLQRQQLIRLSPEGWVHVLDDPWDAGALRCLGLWARRGFPLVVTRQPDGLAGLVAAGLPAPARHGRRRIALGIAPSDVMFFDAFPAADAATRLLPRDQRVRWQRLLRTLAQAECVPRVYGGYGWQVLTRLAYLHEDSDLDLLLPVGGANQADDVCAALAAADIDTPRLDGELLFPDGAAIAWREWCDYRQGRVERVLVKRLHGVALETPAAGAAARATC